MIDISSLIKKMFSGRKLGRDELMARVEFCVSIVDEIYHLSLESAQTEIKRTNDPFLACLEKWQNDIANKKPKPDWAGLEEELHAGFHHPYKPIRITAIFMAMMSTFESEVKNSFNKKFVEWSLENRYMDFETMYLLAFAAGHRVVDPEMIDWLLYVAGANSAELRLNLKSLKRKDSEGEMRAVILMSLDWIYLGLKIKDLSKIIEATHHSNWSIRKIAVCILGSHPDFDQVEVKRELGLLQQELTGDKYYLAIWLKESVDSALARMK